MWKWTVESSAAFNMSDQLQQCPSAWSELILTWHQLGIVVDHLQLGEATQEILLYQSMIQLWKSHWLSTIYTSLDSISNLTH